MALLTADDVLNKKFQSVKFREGYDQIEVDEFLDEIVATIYTLTVENTELKDQLEAANARVAELSSGEVPVAPVQEYVPEPIPEPVPEPEPEAVPVVEVPAAPAPETDMAATTSMLTLAQRLHDEYVNDGRAEAERIVSEAEAHGKEIVDEANNHRENVLRQLADEQLELETSINNLREFESDYRNSVADHLRNLLGQVTSPAEPVGE